MSRDRRTLNLKVVAFRGPYKDAEADFNRVLPLLAVDDYVVKKLEDSSVAEQARAQLGRSLSKESWACLVTVHKLLEGNSKKPMPTFKQFVLIKTKEDNLDELERLVNEFCDKHEVYSIDVSVYEGVENAGGIKTYMAMVKYLVVRV